MILLALVILVVVAALAVGYRKVASSAGTRTANGVLLMLLGAGAVVWLVANWTA